MSVPVVSPVVDRLRQVPPPAWFAVAVVAALAVIVWHQFCRDDEDRDWLDPGQPAINLEVDLRSTVAGVLAPKWRPTKPYPFDSLTQHPDCWIGDC